MESSKTAVLVGDMSKEVKEQLSKITQKIILKKGYSPWQAQLWLQAKNPHMGDISPVEALAKGKFDALWKFIEEGTWEK